MITKLPVVRLQVPQTVGSDDKDNDKIMNEAVPQLKSKEREDDDSDSTGTESSSCQESIMTNGSDTPPGQDVRQVSKVACTI